MPPDIELEENLRSALARDPRVDHDQAIAVFASAGSSPSAAASRASSSATRRSRTPTRSPEWTRCATSWTSGLSPHDPHDDEMRGAALQALIRDPRVHETTIDVAVADRWVTLKGEVRRQHESDAAFEDVATLEGVGGITNAIKVVTAPRLG